MKSLEIFRNKFFWGLDVVKGKNVKHFFDEIEFIQENFHSVESCSRRSNALASIVNHAIKTTKFYKEIPGKELGDFPVIDKNLIRENFSNFVSNKFQEKSLVRVVTSGSTGTPLTILQDKNKKYRNTADTIYFAKQAGFEVGQRIFYLKIWSEANQKSLFKAYAQNVVPVDVLRLRDNEISDFLKLTKNPRHTSGILAYASALEQIARYVESNFSKPIKSNVKSIIAMSETLNKYTQEVLKEYFGVPVVSRYSNIENGILAQQCCTKANAFHLNLASYFIEILSIDENVRVRDGELGRIVVTDLYNYGMPLIRYDTGDIGAISQHSDCCFGSPVLTKLEGRKLDLLYDSSGQIVSSLLVYRNMWKYTEVKQYQLIQKGKKNYMIKINIDTTFQRESELISEFKEFLGNDSSIFVEYVDDIPLLDSGKRRKVVNEYC